MSETVMITIFMYSHEQVISVSHKNVVRVVTQAPNGKQYLIRSQEVVFNELK